MPSSPSAASQVSHWQLKTQRITFDQNFPRLMGIVNATPDSFSDGGNFFQANAAIEQAIKLAEQGADIIDIGGESTRPYSTPVNADEEIRRVVPVIEGIAKHSNIPISIDTSKARVAKAAVQAGAEIINDVTGLEGDAEMLAVALDTKAGVCAMHMQGTPQTMQDNPQYQDVVREIHSYLVKRKIHLLDAGVDLERLCLDPGIGFGKTHEHNLELLRSCDQFLDLGCPILIGHSRKGFIGKLLGDKAAERDSGTLAISLSLALKGIPLLRVHEIERTARALKVFAAL